MKPTFHANPLNGPFEDPIVYINIFREKRSVLFDIGDISKLELGRLLRISDVFVTHTHMDHFIGFDALLRALLRRDAPLRIFGPYNIIECVEGKLKGYTWNLIKDYPLKMEVYGIKEDSVAHASFYAENGFQRRDNPEKPFTGTLMKDPLLRADGLLLSHQIPVMAYSLEEEYHININKALMEEKGLPVGPWLADLKKAIRQEEESQFLVNNKLYALADLMEIVTITEGQKISYVMDLAPDDENMEKVIEFVKGSDMLFCEAYFLDKDKDRALARHHLTAALAGKIARLADVRNLTIMHFSPKYRHCENEIYLEAMREFRG